MKIETTTLPDVLILTPKRFGDTRGYFTESWNRKTLKDHGIDIDFVQDNHSMSATVGTIRGLHSQTPPFAQAKLVRCGRGVVFDVAVDARIGSPTYGQWVGVELSAENGRQLLIPQGFLHGFATRAPNSELIYKCSNYYAPDCEASVRFDDPDLNIDWGLGDVEPVLSDKDAIAGAFSGFSSGISWGGPAT
ncbi:dTDP-4-dehydrorhamnose 3,5-epimerase [Roseobacter sp. HKCCD9010]|uniref:dTDP-4-dehydrorhamnose 3,5-epimerase n=1 Tax=unclassified Roseobacter TaxID=196798 RepID=UPI001490E65F|nr:dTDP-4-dehydrorhamnose 3,5-epimerase [Rhodobacterales bacterium HKCCD4356]NNV10495.1 dTDP-4-dehydrorhamnose 3,5-epimerase [Roseobacter sp. HKCCD7357]NNV14680.1 dTDP-4-dehydrorhamnose 3,5-epimerase [Roseobacter sp. HKCCD8768]NNV24139.1 dTDP-4-dehydrorhamnose 3,5-epimerase [Roseobacter sp. HKCCD8192]NNV28396.1 dTDP-4-dehydrorhamnose 3,5-epimerase [Roseobacter sp. HKCCD9061]NNV32669.1 dTDP-4-dehydrorhamnose 3,5-epimerase [Roseobacter sp. HKCCD9073]NNV36920.1 dTDP-4-dehydrorhamnose 3,5-epimera